MRRRRQQPRHRGDDQQDVRFRGVAPATGGVAITPAGVQETIAVVAHDLHPEYVSTRFAETLSMPWAPEGSALLTVERALTQAAMHSHYHRGQNATRLRELGNDVAAVLAEVGATGADEVEELQADRGHASEVVGPELALEAGLTKNQIIAAILCFGMLIPIFSVGLLDSMFTGKGRDWLSYLNLWDHMDEFSRGIVDSRRLVYYLSATVFFLFLSVVSITAKKERP